MTRTLALVLTLLGCTHALAGDFNPSATVVVNGRDTHVSNLEYSRWSLENCKDPQWNHVGKEIDLECVMNTEDGAPAEAFTYHFVEISKKQTRLIKITTANGTTLNSPAMEKRLPNFRGAARAAQPDSGTNPELQKLHWQNGDLDVSDIELSEVYIPADDGKTIEAHVQVWHFARYCIFIGGTSKWYQRDLTSFVLRCSVEDGKTSLFHFLAKSKHEIVLDQIVDGNSKLGKVDILLWANDVYKHLDAMNKKFGSPK